MQGQLNEIDIRSILQLIELGQRTGELFVEAYPSSSLPPTHLASPIETRSTKSLSGHSWFDFFLNVKSFTPGRLTLVCFDCETTCVAIRQNLR